MNFKFAFIASIVFISCANDKSQEKSIPNDVTIDKKLSANSDFEKLRGSSAYAFIHRRGEEDTSGIALMNEYAGDSSLMFSFLWRCAAFFESDTLSIFISFDGPHSGDGIVIDYANKKKFSAEPYRWNHMIKDINEKTKYTIIRQDLVLDKSKYEPGDSIFGKLDLHYSQVYDGETKEYRKKATFLARIESGEK